MMSADTSEAQLHSISLKVLGLTGITEHEKTADANPKQMRAVVATTRDAVSYGFSGPSRRLVKSPRNDHFIAIWTSGNPNVIEFETEIEPQPRRSLHRNFELVVGITSSRSVQPIPIGAASLPLQQAVALRSRDTGKIVLDLPIFNLASQKGNPFQVTTKTANEVSFSSASAQKSGGLFRSRSLRHNRSCATTGTGSTSVATLSPSWKPSDEASVPQIPCPYRLDSGRDASILRIEIEVKEQLSKANSTLLNSNLVLVQPTDNAIESVHSVEIRLSESDIRHDQYRVKIVDETTMDCELAPVKKKVCPPRRNEEYSSTSTLVSSTEEILSVENNLYVWPSGVERVLSEHSISQSEVLPVSKNDGKTANNDETILANQNAGIEIPIGGALASVGRKPSFFRLLPRIRSKSVPSVSARGALERPLPSSTPSCDKPDGSMTKENGVCPSADNDRLETLPPQALHVKQTSKLLTIGEGQTAAPETFQATPERFSPKSPAGFVPFSLATNIINAPPPPARKKVKEIVPLGTILQAPNKDSFDDNIDQHESPFGFASSVEKHFKGMFMPGQEEESSDEETEWDSFRSPALRDDFVDLVASFRDMCRPMKTVDDSMIEPPTWTDDDNADKLSEDDASASENDSNKSNDIFGDIHSGEGTEVDVSKAVPLRQRSGMFLRELPKAHTATQPVQEPSQPSSPPKKLFSVLKNGGTKSSQPDLMDDANNGSPNCVSQLPHDQPSPLNPISMARNFLDYVTNTITPTTPEEEKFPVPSVFLEARDTISVGDLTATSHELQIDMHKFRKLIEDHLEQARDNRTEYVDGNIDMFHLTEDEQSSPPSEDQLIPKVESSSWEEFSTM